MNKSTEEIMLSYRYNLDELNSAYLSLNKKDSRYALIRLFIAISGTALLILAFNISVTVSVLTFLVLGIGFLVVYVEHEKIKDQLSENKAREFILKNEILCLEEHQNMYYNGQHFMSDSHDYVEDLDIFGRHSLFSIINRSKTFHGNKFLSDYLGGLPLIDELYLRRGAVEELTKKTKWRQDLAVTVYNIDNPPDADFCEQLIRNFDADFSIFDGKQWSFLIRLVPLAWMGIAMMMVMGVPYAMSTAVILGFGLFTLYFLYQKKVNELQFTISHGNELLESYGKAFQLIFNTPWESEMMVGLVEKDNRNEQAIHSVFKLRKLMDKLDYRLNMIAGAILNFTVLWDFRIIRKLNQWKKSHLSGIQELFLILGKLEALSSLATWAYNHPDYHFSHVDEEHFHCRVKEMIHPLMKNEACVPNDFEITNRDHISIVTGSNMSGKSTFLRTLGINIVLSFSGTVSAARSMEISLTKVVTYMRVRDALEENVSTFRAELDRVRMIMDYVDNGTNCLCLIDEMLRGTNSLDKLKGSVAITRKLVNSGAYAIIATHDIKLTELEKEFPEKVKNYYFDIEFRGDDLIFDYRIKPGICSNFNASFLLEKIGIS